MDATESGPVDIVMLRFTGNKFNGEIAPALRDLVVRGLVRSSISCSSTRRLTAP